MATSPAPVARKPVQQTSLPSDLHGRRAVVTGGASGIGYAIVLRLAQAGAKVIAIDRDKERLQKAFAGDQWAEKITTVEGDFSEETDSVVLLAESLLANGPIELIVNNVGICTGTSYFETSERDVDTVLRTNLKNPLFFTRRLVEELLDQDRPGSVLFISSLHDRFISGRPQYSISKAGVSMAARELAAELAAHRIRVNTISPGWIDTQSEKQGHTELPKSRRLTPLVPLSRPGEPDDVAKLAVFLLSDECASYITGENIAVDGGLSLHSWEGGGSLPP